MLSKASTTTFPIQSRLNPSCSTSTLDSPSRGDNTLLLNSVEHQAIFSNWRAFKCNNDADSRSPISTQLSAILRVHATFFGLISISTLPIGSDFSNSVIASLILSGIILLGHIFGILLCLARSKTIGGQWRNTEVDARTTRPNRMTSIEFWHFGNAVLLFMMVIVVATTSDPQWLEKCSYITAGISSTFLTAGCHLFLAIRPLNYRHIAIVGSTVSCSDDRAAAKLAMGPDADTESDGDSPEGARDAPAFIV